MTLEKPAKRATGLRRGLEPPYVTEAELCAAFMAWARERGATCYAEWAGWDILVVLSNGVQLGIQAKLQLNAHVIGQALEGVGTWFEQESGPDFRGVLVPKASGPLVAVAGLLGLEIFYWTYRDKIGDSFSPALERLASAEREHYGAPQDWCPPRRVKLPPTETDAVAGSACPVTLTTWKLRALDVLAEIEVRGQVTTQFIRQHAGINPSRWLQAHWLVAGAERGIWLRGDRCPKFDEQHPAAYAYSLEQARLRASATEAA